METSDNKILRDFIRDILNMPDTTAITDKWTATPGIYDLVRNNLSTINLFGISSEFGDDTSRRIELLRGRKEIWVYPDGEIV